MKNQEKVWNEISEGWIKYRKHGLIEVKEFLRNKIGKILDLGCGSGRNFYKNKGVIYGVDFSKKMLSYAKKLAKERKIKVELFKDDIESLPFPDNYCDSALCISVLHSIPGARKRKKVLKESNRVLKSGAELLLTVWDKNQKRFENFKEGYFPWKYKNKEYARYVYIYNKNELVNLLESCGFKVTKVMERKNLSKFSRKNLIIYCKKK